MGISPSKQVSENFRNSADFNSACDSVYEEYLDLTHHPLSSSASDELSSASGRLHQYLVSLHFPLIQKWVPTPPTLSQVDKALTRQFNQKPDPVLGESKILIGRDEFKEFAVDLFTDAVISNGGSVIEFQQVLIDRFVIDGSVIDGIGALTSSPKELFGGLLRRMSKESVIVIDGSVIDGIGALTSSPKELFGGLLRRMSKESVIG